MSVHLFTTLKVDHAKGPLHFMYTYWWTRRRNSADVSLKIPPSVRRQF